MVGWNLLDFSSWLYCVATCTLLPHLGLGLPNCRVWGLEGQGLGLAPGPRFSISAAVAGLVAVAYGYGSPLGGVIINLVVLALLATTPAKAYLGKGTLPSSATPGTSPANRQNLWLYLVIILIMALVLVIAIGV